MPTFNKADMLNCCAGHHDFSDDSDECHVCGHKQEPLDPRARWTGQADGGLYLTLSGDGRPERSRLILKPATLAEAGAAKQAASAALLVAGYAVSG